jgi:thiol-disulfide isomerase/thioredoxin
MPDQSPPRPTATRRIPLVIGAVLVGAVIGYFGVNSMGAWKRGASGDAACNGAVDLAKKLAPLTHGEVAALTMATTPQRLPDLAFEDAEGKPKKLSDWRGKTLLVNLWATWCVPCRKEMPALDALQAKLGGKDFEVVAINIDKGGSDKAAAFLKETGAEHVALYTDPTGKLFSTIKTVGMPTTLIVDRDGKEIARLIGPADWASPEAIAVIEAAIAAPASAS